MRHRLLASAGGINWGAPSTHDVSPRDAGEYVASFSTSDPGIEARNQLIVESTSPVSGDPCMAHRGKVNLNDNGQGTLACTYNFGRDDLIIAPGRTYRIQGELELSPTAQVSEWDAQSWSVFVIGYPQPNQGGTASLAFIDVNAATPSNNAVQAVSVDTTFVMPGNTKSLAVTYAHVSKWNNANQGAPLFNLAPVMYFWDWSLTLQ